MVTKTIVSIHWFVSTNFQHWRNTWDGIYIATGFRVGHEGTSPSEKINVHRRKRHRSLILFVHLFYFILFLLFVLFCVCHGKVTKRKTNKQMDRGRHPTDLTLISTSSDAHESFHVCIPYEYVHVHMDSRMRTHTS